MSQISGLQLNNLSAAEMEFSAGEVLITVTSQFDHPEFKFISGDYGPLEAGLPCEIPLWLAIALRRKGKCRIEIPEWMSVTSLESCVTHERSDNTFYPLPFHYLEISQLLIKYAKEDIKMIDKVSALLKDLEEIRMDRARLGLFDMAEKVREGDAVQAVSLPHISNTEIQTLKPMFIDAMTIFKKLTDVSEEDNLTNRASDGPSSRYAVDTQDEATPAPTRKLRRFQKTDN